MTVLLGRLNREVCDLVHGYAVELEASEDCLVVRPATDGSGAASLTVCVDDPCEVRIMIGEFVHYELHETDPNALTHAVLDVVTAVLQGGLEEKRWVDRAGNVRSAEMRFRNGARVTTSRWPVIRFGTTLQRRVLPPFEKTNGPAPTTGTGS